MNIAVIGSRTFNQEGRVDHALSKIFKPGDRLISGGARGADSLAETWCGNRGFQCVIIRPNWKKYGRSAGFKRNHQIIDQAEFVVAFWDGNSKGTKHSIDLAKGKGIKVMIVRF